MPLVGNLSQNPETHDDLFCCGTYGSSREGFADDAGAGQGEGFPPPNYRSSERLSPTGGVMMDPLVLCEPRLIMLSEDRLRGLQKMLA